MIKKCEECGEDYSPNFRNWSVQKFCSRSCKDKSAWKRNKKTGNVRVFKGGYPRAVIIEKWIEAQKADEGTVACHYCRERVTPETFQIDHMRPISKLENREQVNMAENLIICCEACNREKGSRYEYKEFLELKRNGKI